ncbi:hypothetical protein AMJ96_PB00067 (plasmid) [Rhizobium sp. N113]|uniref:Hypothetical conserved protein n=1 Tax=Rhizobium etli (strain CIAT 652) TaxID=491916 RepID=B3Q271_RHIE6|nr:hypothetical conserved protein [Rhizobium etli CIAT 652]ANL24388.1 hypothetical protein AMJ96_PB00067 [Rhizobium sp. N113]OHV22722.1 hypothetical protein BBJ66_29320 [Rhizobium sp. RSm-3]
MTDNLGRAAFVSSLMIRCFPRRRIPIDEVSSPPMDKDRPQWTGCCPVSGYRVIIFVLSFIISICAVGFSGHYAAGLLQGRLETSSEVMQVLSCFRDVSASSVCIALTPCLNPPYICRHFRLISIQIV